MSLNLEITPLEEFFKEVLDALLKQFPLKETPKQLALSRLELFLEQKKIWLHVRHAGFNLTEKMTLESRLKAIAAKVPELKIFELLIYYSSAIRKPNTMQNLRSPTSESSRAFGLRLKKKSIPGIKTIILVASGKGGVGKSTVSTNLAVALSKEHSVGLVDADIYGPSAQQMLGCDGPLKVTPEGKLAPKEVHGIKAASFAFFTDSKEPVLWRGPMVAKAIKQLFFDVDWGNLDFLIVDLPPGTGDVHLAIIEEIDVAGAVVVTTGQDVALIDAVKAIEMFARLDVPLWGLVNNMAFFECGTCTTQHFLFADTGLEKISLDYRVPVLAHLPFAIQLRQDCDRGTPSAQELLSPVGKEFKRLASSIASRAYALWQEEACP